MTPAQVITASTRTLRPSSCGCRMQCTVEAGKSADFLVLDANPLDDITKHAANLERLLAWNGGRSRRDAGALGEPLHPVTSHGAGIRGRRTTGGPAL
jgi:hypothetical protein